MVLAKSEFSRGLPSHSFLTSCQECLADRSIQWSLPRMTPEWKQRDCGGRGVPHKDKVASTSLQMCWHRWVEAYGGWNGVLAKRGVRRARTLGRTRRGKSRMPTPEICCLVVPVYCLGNVDSCAFTPSAASTMHLIPCTLWGWVFEDNLFLSCNDDITHCTPPRHLGVFLSGRCKTLNQFFSLLFRTPPGQPTTSSKHLTRTF